MSDMPELPEGLARLIRGLQNPKEEATAGMNPAQKRIADTILEVADAMSDFKDATMSVGKLVASGGNTVLISELYAGYIDSCIERLMSCKARLYAPTAPDVVEEETDADDQ